MSGNLENINKFALQGLFPLSERTIVKIQPWTTEIPLTLLRPEQIIVNILDWHLKTVGANERASKECPTDGLVLGIKHYGEQSYLVMFINDREAVKFRAGETFLLQVDATLVDNHGKETHYSDTLPVWYVNSSAGESQTLFSWNPDHQLLLNGQPITLDGHPITLTTPEVTP